MWIIVVVGVVVFAVWLDGLAEDHELQLCWLVEEVRDWHREVCVDLARGQSYALGVQPVNVLVKLLAVAKVSVHPEGA